MLLTETNPQALQVLAKIKVAKAIPMNKPSVNNTEVKLRIGKCTQFSDSDIYRKDKPHTCARSSGTKSRVLPSQQESVSVVLTQECVRQ